MTEYVYYMLRVSSGDTYIGVTGQSLRRRVSQHIREGRIGEEFEVIVLGSASSRTEIKGGTSIDGYRHGESIRRKTPLQPRKPKKPKRPKRPEVYCRKGHELTSASRCERCRREYLAAYYENKLRPPHLKRR